MVQARGASPEDKLFDDVARICGKANVSIDARERVFYSSDLFEAGVTPDIVAAPANTRQVARLVKLAVTEKRPVYVRGGGMSYSDAFLPAKERALLLDMSRLNKVREIKAEDFYVTVEAGCTWQALDEALAPHGLRALFWGPASGKRAQVGGSMSQETANNNSGSMGTSSAAALSYEIVTGTGDVLVTGMDAQKHRSPNHRPYGPDLTGLFSSDAGALGIKTAVTLKLEPRPQAQGGVSYAFSSFAALKTGVHKAASLGIATAIIGMDAGTAQIRSGKTGLAEDFKKLIAIIRTAHNPLRGLVRGIKIALAGRKVFEEAKYTAHFLAEAPNNSLLAHRERALRKAVGNSGNEIPSAAISMMRAEMFPDLATTHYDGRRMLPIHGVFAWSRLQAFQADYQALIESYRDQLEAQDVVIADILSAFQRNGVLFEPVFYWYDEITDFHRRTRTEDVHGPAPDSKENPDARALVNEIKDKVVTLMGEHGAAHMQIGKFYPYMAGRNAKNAGMLKDLKARLDPHGIINPGALGLTGATRKKR